VFPRPEQPVQYLVTPGSGRDDSIFARQVERMASVFIIKEDTATKFITNYLIIIFYGILFVYMHLETKQEAKLK